MHEVRNTKDTCPQDFVIQINDHLDYKTLIEHYTLVPHRKQIIVSAGYIAFGGNARKEFDECNEPQKDSLFIRIPATEQQLASKLKFWGKVKTSRGVEYKALPTRKLPGKGMLVLQAPMNATMLDTIYLGKKIDEKELGKYFYEVNNPHQTSAFAVGNRFFVAYSVDKHGAYQLKEPLRNLFRIIPEQEEDKLPEKGNGRRLPTEEQIED